MSDQNNVHDDAAAVLRYEAAISESRRAEDMDRPSMKLRPRLSIDGNQWCALYGENIQDGVVGFGDSPAEAMADFDKSWFAKLPTAAKAEGRVA